MKTNSTLRILAFGTSLCTLLGFGRLRAMDALDIWLLRPAPSQNSIGITYGRGMFVAVGYGGTILTSTTGVVWTNQVSGTDRRLDDVTFANGIFVAVGGGDLNPIILTSPDGIAWTQRSANSAYPLTSVAYGNGTFVAVGVAGTAMTSVDGLSWVAGPGMLSTRHKIAYGNGTFVAVGYDPGFGSPIGIEVSTNGVTWSQGGTSSSTELYGVAFAGGFVAVGSAGTILTSPDGGIWTQQHSGTSKSLFGISYGNGSFVAVGNSGTILTSTDGVAWTSRDSPSLGANLLQSISYADGRFVVTGGQIWQSADTTLGGSYATISGHCLSVDLGSFSGALPPYGTVTNYVTTFDGATGVPLEDQLTNGEFRTSGELRPRVGQAGVYEADYLTRTWDGTLVQYGGFTLNLPLVDSDTNGVPDLLQADQPGDATIGGTASSDWPVASSLTTSATLLRSVGSGSGSYRIEVSGPGGSAFYTGTLHLLELGGYVAYSRQPTNLIHVEMTRTDPGSGVVQLLGSSSFVVPNTESLGLPQLRLQGSDGAAYTLLPMSLTRVGRNYSNTMTFVDGNPFMSWPDYTQWVWTFSDSTDSDGNGIPDLTDVVPPKLRIFTSQNHVTIAWPVSASGYGLEACSGVLETVWSRVEIAPTMIGEELQVLQPIAEAQQFYRLRLAP